MVFLLLFDVLVEGEDGVDKRKDGGGAEVIFSVGDHFFRRRNDSLKKRTEVGGSVGGVGG